MTHKLLIILGILLLGMTAASCQRKSTVLSYGKPIDLSKIDWQAQELDTLFSKIVYSKQIKYKKSDEVYHGEKPLTLQWVYKYNVDTTLYSNQLDERYFRVIQPNENNLVVREIYRTYVGATNDTLESKGPFGYYVNKEIFFGNIETLSNIKDEAEILKMIRLNQSYEDEKPYFELLAILKERYKGITYYENTISLGRSGKWMLEDKVIDLSIYEGRIDDQVHYTMFLEIKFK